MTRELTNESQLILLQEKLACIHLITIQIFVVFVTPLITNEILIE